MSYEIFLLVCILVIGFFIINFDFKKCVLATENDRKLLTPRIVSAAAKNHIGEIISSPRHYDKTFHNIVKQLPESYRQYWKGSSEFQVIQGFIDQYGNFYTREEAWIIAKHQNQIVRRVGGDGKKLFSENLY